jgi:hypothetical protein
LKQLRQAKQERTVPLPDDTELLSIIASESPLVDIVFVHGLDGADLTARTRLTHSWSRDYFDATSQITHLFWLYRPGARPIGGYVLATPPCGVHKRSIAAPPMYP